jgi:hypothetical protein
VPVEDCVVLTSFQGHGTGRCLLHKFAKIAYLLKITLYIDIWNSI